ncbi:hypothetical protein THAOC_32760 [Thalassiosira oceanica]|uniref:RING-type domain-containing protein n=1 Tax=Thalassiosira oceanica TaxID=159749 RepID=K0R8H2_THAOC|nr:hypothetical protein THAOC_32760 [Thalassiosira oceanica]|eukprot:EJK48439.1 hypothetical protein THAOC_32760 [Thalassiosira oceanica]
MKISGACLKSLVCGACERDLPEGSYSVEQRGLRQSSRRCDGCVASGNQLVLIKKGRTRLEADDCPICQLPLPLDMKNTSFRPCCLKEVCHGCVLATRKRGMLDCPFCRTPASEKEQALAMVRKRVHAGDPLAIYFLGNQYHFGQCGLEKDETRAVELYERAAELGDKEAHYNLGCLFNLGCEECDAGNYDLALQHWMISAMSGHEDSLSNVKTLFMSGLATKADYAGALRGYQKAMDEMSSPDRDEANALGSEMIHTIIKSKSD